VSQDEIEELCRQIGRISAHTPEKNRVLILLRLSKSFRTLHMRST